MVQLQRGLQSRGIADERPASEDVRGVDRVMENPSRRTEMIHELWLRHGRGTRRQRVRLWRKRLAWRMVVSGSSALKRTIDVAGSGIGLILLFPMMAAVALAIKLTDRGPIFYSAPRVGKWGREFPCPKFRSMVLNADKLKDQLVSENDHGDCVTFKMKRDPRVTWIGRIIRKLSIDELPQLWCVLIGDMSLVGPRPPVPREVALYTLSDRRRLDVKPGLTCFWQVEGRGDIPFERQVELDVAYIQSRSFRTDLRILLKTIPAVLLGKGAY